MEKVNRTTTSSAPFPFSSRVKIKHIPIKRCFDIGFSLFCLIAGAPLFLMIAAVIYFTSPGKVIYSHERIGRGGRLFRCYKFRSMYADADQRLNELLEKNPLLKEEWTRTFKLKRDPRITPFGRFIRKTSLDELPQFWNVLKGDLSVVGPRPVVKEEIDQFYSVKAHKILSIRPGITGLWQVSARGANDCYEHRILLDEHYVDHHSLLMDLKLIGKTLPAILLAKGR